MNRRIRGTVVLSMIAGVVLALAGPRIGPAMAQTEPGSLQAAIDATPDDGTLTVPPGTYREAVVIRRPITLSGTGAEIVGSDVWTTWEPTDTGWRSTDVVPPFEGSDFCVDPRCAWPEQVFIDGEPLLQVAAEPGPGQFALDPERHVLLADDPGGRLVEVTTRTRWMEIEAPDVTVDGFAMHHAGTPAQNGALQVWPGGDRATIRNVTLRDAHGALVSFQGVTDAALTESDLRRGGQLAVHAGGDGTTGLRIIGNHLAESNTEGFDPSWEAGGLKAALAVGLVLQDNVVEGNDGPGLWCDIDCRDITIQGNRVIGNSNAGIHFEISDGAEIIENVVVDNGWGFSTWGWGAGILVSSSAGAEIRDNTLAWNADGIVVVSQDRGPEQPDLVRDVFVVDNTVIGQAGTGFLLAWLEDWEGGVFDDGSENDGQGNAFWPDTGMDCPFEWDGCRSTLEAFVATPGGVDSRYLAQDEEPAVLASADVAQSPTPHDLNEPPQIRRYIPAAIAAAGGILLIGILVAVVVIRRKRTSRI